MHKGLFPLYRNNRNDGRKGGGVCILVKSNLKSKLIKKSDDNRNFCQYLLVEVFDNDRKALLGVVYKPPDCNSLSNFYESLSELAPQYIHIIIGGDFNIDVLKPAANVSELKSWVFSNGLYFVNEVSATHFQGTPTLIDHFITSSMEHILQYQQLDGSAYSKHDVLYLTYNLHFDINVESLLSFRDFKNINHEKLFHDIGDINWSECLCHNIDHNVEVLERNIVSLFNNNVPMKNVKAVNSCHPWMNAEILRLIKERNAAYRKFKKSLNEVERGGYRSLYNSIRNKVQHEIYQAKVRFYNTLM